MRRNLFGQFISASLKSDNVAQKHQWSFYHTGDIEAARIPIYHRARHAWRISFVMAAFICQYSINSI